LFVQEGSTDSVYEPPYCSTTQERVQEGVQEGVLLVPGLYGGYGSGLPRWNPGWGGSDPCIGPVSPSSVVYKRPITHNALCVYEPTLILCNIVLKVCNNSIITNDGRPFYSWRFNNRQKFEY